MDHRGHLSLVTGASSGLGAEFATQLAARGSDLVLVARRLDRLDALADLLRSAHGVAVTTVACDLAGPTAAAELTRTLDERGLRPNTLVNNAGFAMHGPVAESDAGRLDEQVAVNVAALVSLTRALLPGLLTHGDGALVNVASTAAFQPIPGMAVYAATKAFVLSFTEALSHETRANGLRVLALCPGPTRTEFFDVVGTTDAAAGSWSEPGEVVGLALRSLDRRATPPSVVAGAANRALAAAAQRLPRRLALAAGARAVSP